MIELSEHESKQRLGGAPMPAELLTDEVEEATAFAASVALSSERRVVAKASGVAHKTEGGLVRLGLDADDVAKCFAKLAAAGDGNVLIAEMVTFDFELIIGISRNDSFGSVITIGAGGITAEAAPDVVAILAPPETGEVADAVSRLRIAPLLGGWRNMPPLDIPALEHIIDRLVVAMDDPVVIAVECNPVAISGGAPVILDALVIVDDRAATYGDSELAS